LYQSEILDNGIQVITERMENVRSVAIGIWFRVGSRDEQPGQYGLSHFMEHMFFKGTSQRDALAISQDFESLGAEQNAFTSKEYTCYYARVVDDKLPAVLEIIADMLMDSQFAPEGLESEREVVIEEIARGEDTPQDYVFELFAAAAMPGHGLGRPIAGSRESVSAFQQADCLSYLQAHYNAANCIVVATGHVDQAEMVTLVQKYLAGMTAGHRQTRQTFQGQAEPFYLLQKDTEQANLVYGLPGLPLGDADRFAGQIMDAALGGGMSSRLFQEIREKRGLAYAVFSATDSYLGAGSFLVYVGTRPENLLEVVSLIQSELARLLAAGLTPAELQRMQDYLVGNTVLAQESTASRMIRLGRNAVCDQEILSLNEIIERLRAVTLNDVQRVAERILRATPTLAVISPLATAGLQAELNQLLA